jgi:pimeloyl-ACP methyl ester carboxylesterase
VALARRGQLLILIHGAVGCAAEIEPLAAALRHYGEVTTPNLIGHGGRPIPEHLSIEAMARDVVDQCDQAGVGPAFVVGYSLGATLALYLARHYPQRFLGVCALAPKIVFDARTISHWTHLADPDRLRRNGRSLIHEKNHAPQDWVEVTRVNSELFRALGEHPPLEDADLAAITVPVMIVSGDRDPLVPWEEAKAIAKAIPASHLAMFYGGAHPMGAIPLHQIARAITGWMDSVRTR